MLVFNAVKLEPTVLLVPLLQENAKLVQLDITLTIQPKNALLVLLDAPPAQQLRPAKLAVLLTFWKALVALQPAV